MFKLLMENSSHPECGMLSQLAGASILRFTVIYLSNALGLTPFSYTEINISLKNLSMKQHQLNLQIDQFIMTTGKLKSDFKMF